MKDWLKHENGSAMLLALLFLLFCTLTGSALLASAAANASRSARETQAREDWLACRSALLVVREELTSAGQPQLTIRDVTVREKKTSRRTVTYILQNCGDSVILEYLIAGAITQYEAEKGAPDAREWEGFPFESQIVTDTSRALELTAESGDERRTLTGMCTITDDLDLNVELGTETGKLTLRMAAVTGTGTPVKLSANGITTVTKTTVIRWETPVVGKGDADG